ncbi:MAG TPA: tetratricopeptide repeat protein [Vicinamibacterales bacterium]|nr:tetratricopeptide repeat protein [Vicinamibacterales bacterium]
MGGDPNAAESGSPRLHTGDRIGPYVIFDIIGSGGMGEVYRARDERLERDVAIKRLSVSAIGGDDVRVRVLREARAAAGLSHPNIAAVYDVLESPDGLVIVMEYVPGEPLAARVARGPLPAEDALRIAMQIAEALTDAHDHGVIHRDLKPANVHLTPGGKAKILDFGIARSVSKNRSASGGGPDTEAGRIIGTPGYMAPEQMSGAPSDARTDIYGVGLLLFEMLTGRGPFDKRDPLGSARAIFQGAVPRVTDIDPTLPAAVSSVVARAMALEPEDRFPNARELHGALAHALRLQSDAPTIDETDRAISRSSTAWPATRRRLAQHRVALSIVTVVVAVVALLVWRSVRDAWSPLVSAHPATLAVLPLHNRSGDAQNDAIALGLTEGIATRLSVLNRVRILSMDDSREAAANASDPTSAARTLGAAFVLEGGLQRKGQALEVDMTLVRNDGHRTPAGHYTGDVSQLFALHERVAEGLTGVLSGEGLTSGAPSTDVGPPTSNQEAFADYSQARVFLERPDDPENLRHAVRLFESALQKDSRFAAAHAGLGQAYWALYQETNDRQWTTKATAAILDALRIDPDQPEVRLSLAVMYRGLGRVAEARDELGRVLLLQPANDDAHRMLAGMHTDLGEWDQGAAEAHKAIALRPNYWRNHAELGFARFRAGRLEEAVKAYERVTQLQPDSARGYHMLGTVQQSAGDIAAALQSYQKANEILPTAATWSNMGTVLFWEGEYVKAAEAYERAIELLPNEPDLHANLGDVQQMLGRPDDAARSYQRAIDEVSRLLEVNDRNPVNLAILAMYQAKLGNRAAAESAIEKARSISPQDGDVLYNRAIVHALAGKQSEACTALEQALARGASAVIVSHAEELKPLKGCAAYDRITAAVR